MKFAEFQNVLRLHINNQPLLRISKPIVDLDQLDQLQAISKYPPAELVALLLLAPQRGLFATARSKSKSKSLVLLSSLPQKGKFDGEYIPGILKVLLPPRQSRGISP
ncbi:MAG: hypothetical protein P4K86_01405 [Terracidiphilus sp.]|nr:hypothetical protein [Terracidiphilus sp.]